MRLRLASSKSSSFSLDIYEAHRPTVVPLGRRFLEVRFQSIRVFIILIIALNKE